MNGERVLHRHAEIIYVPLLTYNSFSCDVWPVSFLLLVRRLTMEVTFYWYPKCGTCRKAKKWLEDHQVDVEAIHIVEQPPTKEQLKEYYQKSGLEIKKLFNTSGQKYRALGLKDKIQDASEEELLELLSSDGMLIKRPILISDQTVLFGFKEEQYENMLNKS